MQRSMKPKLTERLIDLRYFFINSVYGKRSTGKIIADKCHELQNMGHICMVAYGREAIDDPAVQMVSIGKRKDYLVHAALSRVFDLHGLCSKRATERLIHKIEDFTPDVIWLHNIHGYYINYEILFDWIKKNPSIKVYWTLHDCWSFTGHCAYFTMAKCDRWKSGCHNCPQLKSYPKCYGFDRSKKNYLQKKSAFTGVNDMTLITPSVWLAELTRRSFLAEYPVKVINNTVNEEVFRPVESNFRVDHGIENKYIVLGVAVGWEVTKGLQDMLALREKLDDSYVMVLVGVTKKQIKNLPKGIIGISRTENQQQLAEIYSVADVFINPTHQDNYPTVNLEARACGATVVTYNIGGSPESADSENVVDENDIDGLVRRVTQICEHKQ